MQLSESLMLSLESIFINRIKTSYKELIPKNDRGTNSYYRIQTEFFIGAMSAFNTLGYSMPLKWTVALMSNRLIIPLEKWKLS